MFVSVKDIHKTYNLGKKQIQVLKGITFAINEGEIVAIMGKSGSGKSTLLNIIGTLDFADKGEVSIAGKNILKYGDSQLSQFRNRNIGFVFQFHYLLSEFTALENVYLPGMIAGEKSKKQLKNNAQKLLERVELGNRLHHKTGELSGGEQQRVAFARALINNPGLILADEPSGNLDSISSEHLHNLMWDYARENNAAFIVVTHDHGLSQKADRVIKLEDGKIL